MTADLRKRIIIIFIVVAGCFASIWPIQKRINLGLDLKGGMHLILKVDNEALKDDGAKNDAVLRSMEVLRNRIDGLGVGETLIQRQGQNQILVQLPGVTDRNKAIEMVGRVAHLEFRLVNSDPAKLTEAIAGNVSEGFILLNSKEESGKILVEKESVLGGEAIKDARVDFDEMGGIQPKISLTFNDKGAKTFADVTTAHVNERLAIVLDNEVISAPNIREPILSGTAEITGTYKIEEANLLALALRSGALPVPMHIEEERTIGPLLGKDSIEAGFKAVILGGILIVLFMVFYYLLGGLIASLALVVNFLMILGSMGLLNILMPDAQVTLTLPGIAGIILTLGMAVDANVLINERIREEIKNGLPLNASVKAGYNRAWSAILDSHVTSLIAGFLLFQFGSGPIKGFAVTLTTGLIASMFTSIYITRTVYMWLISAGMIKNLPMMQIFKNPNFNFLNKSTVCFILSGLILGYGMFNLVQKKDSAYGIDFAGGQIQEFKFTKAIDAEKIRSIFKEAKLNDAVIQTFPNSPETVIIRTSEDTHDTISGLFKAKMMDNAFEVMRIEKVGPVVGQALRTKAMYAIIFAMLGMLIYVGFRFKHFNFAAASVVAIFHDVLITLGIIVLMGRQIDLLVVTALMTIAGYSINDSIVIYDRVRENVVKSKNKPLAEVINDSINQTLGRSVLTTSVTMLSVLALFFFGGEVLNTFSLVLIIGFIFGTYSTVYIVSPLFLMLHGSKKW